MLRYTVLRLLVFFGVLCLLWLVGLRSADERVLLLVAAALLSMPISYFALRPFREDYSRQIAERLAARDAAREHKRTDEHDEDAALDGEQSGSAGPAGPPGSAGSPGSPGSSTPHRHDDDFR